MRALPPEAKTVTYTIVEGRLKDIRIEGLKGLNRDYVATRLKPGKDHALNVDNMREQFQLLLDDPRDQARLMASSNRNPSTASVTRF